MQQNQKSSYRSLVFLVITGLLLQLAVAAMTEGYSYDQSCFLAWALRMAETGPGDFYETGYFCDYPPGYLYILWVVGKLITLLNLNAGGSGTRALLALFPALGGCALSCLAWHTARRSGSSHLALPLAAGILFCPALFFDTAVWKQIDAFFLLPLSLAFCLLEEKRFLPAMLCYGLSLSIKPQALLAGPVLATAFLAALYHERRHLRAVGRLLLAAVLSLFTVLAAALPFFGFHTLSGLWEKYLSTGTSYAYAVVNAFNLAQALGGNWVSQSEYLGPLTWQQWGILMLLLLTAALAALCVAGLRKGTFSPLLLSAFYTAGVFTLSHRMHERYLMPGLILTLLAAAKWNDRRLIGAAAGMSITGLVNLVQVYGYVGTEDEFMTGALPSLAARLGGTAETAFFVLLAWTAAELTLGHEPQRLCALKSAAPHIPLPQPRWSKKETLYLVALTVSVLAVSVWNLGDTSAPQNALDAQNGSRTVSAQTQTPAAALWVYPGVSYNGLLEVYDSETGVLLGSVELGYSNPFHWESLSLGENSGSYQIAVSGGMVLELSFRDEEGAQLAVSGEGSLFDEQSLVPQSLSYRNSTYFDEIYHARTAYEMANRMTVYETTHPPLGKDLIMLGILIFGMNGFGWRIMGTLFGVAMVPVFYLLARRLTRSPRYALLGAGLLALDGMRFVQTRIATIDVYATFFILLSAYFMVWYAQSVLRGGVHRSLLPMALCGISFGLGCASKWTGIYAGAGLAAVYFAVLWLRKKQSVPGFSQEIALALGGGVVFFVILPFGIYLASYLPYWWRDASFSLQDWWSCQKYMYWYHSTLEATHPYESRWYTWPLLLRPVWYYAGSSLAEGCKASIAAVGNPVVWWSGTAGVGALVWRCLSGHGDRRSVLVLTLWLVQILPWLLVSRCTFLYHYFPGMLFSILALILALESARREGHVHKRLTSALPIAAGICFILFYPLYSGMSVSTGWLEWLKWLPTWGW